MPVIKSQTMRGFTLIELILGIVMIAIVMTLITGLIAPQARLSAGPVIQIKANELGQSLMNEILGKAFDEVTEANPPFRRCSETGFTACSSTLGADTGEDRLSFDDVDDYIGSYSGSALVNSLGQSIESDYVGFSYVVSVVYDGDYDGVADTNHNAKLITVIVTSSTDESYGFSAYKGNY